VAADWGRTTGAGVGPGCCLGSVSTVGDYAGAGSTGSVGFSAWWCTGCLSFALTGSACSVICCYYCYCWDVDLDMGGLDCS